MTKHILIIGTAVLALLVAVSCEKDITVDIPAAEEQLVVEGEIETGGIPMLTLTRTNEFFGTTNINDIEAMFVHDADVIVYAKGDTVQLEELCFNSLPEDFQRELAASMGYEFSDSADIPNICIYTLPFAELIDFYTTGNASMIGEDNTHYGLHIKAEGKVVTSSVFIPPTIPIDGVSWRPHPQEGYDDSLVTLLVNFAVPDSFGNYVRYWTKRNSQPFYTPLSGSVYDDRLFVGSTFNLPLERGQSPDSDFDGDTYSYFWRGDTVTLKWTNISKATYDFYFTLEADGGDTPFSSPTVVNTNIEGGLGIWAGYASQYETVVIPE